jgi:hypothetical protein
MKYFYTLLTCLGLLYTAKAQPASDNPFGSGGRGGLSSNTVYTMIVTYAVSPTNGVTGAAVTNIINMYVLAGNTFTNPVLKGASFDGAVATFTANALTASDSLALGYLGASANSYLYYDGSSIAGVTLSSNTFLWSAPGGIIRTGIIGSNLSFDPATGTLSATGSGIASNAIANINGAGTNLTTYGPFTVINEPGETIFLGSGQVTIDGPFLVQSNAQFNLQIVALGNIDASGRVSINTNLHVSKTNFISHLRVTNSVYFDGVRSNASANIPLMWDIANNEVVKGSPDLTLNFGNGTRSTTNGTNATLELSLALSNYFWLSTNHTSTASLTNATTGLFTNSIVLTPGRIMTTLLSTNGTVYNTNVTGYIADTVSESALWIQTGPGNATWNFNTGAVHGLKFTCNTNNTIGASMTLAGNSTYIYSASRFATNIIHSLIKQD